MKLTEKELADKASIERALATLLEAARLANMVVEVHLVPIGHAMGMNLMYGSVRPNNTIYRRPD